MTLYKETEFQETTIGSFPKEWPVTVLGDIARVQGGYAFKSTDYVSEGIPLIRIANVSFKQVIFENLAKLPNSYLEKYSEFALENNDIVLALTRPIIDGGIKAAKIDEKHTPALLNQRVGRLQIKDCSRIITDYLLYLIFSESMIIQIKKNIVAMNQPNISTSEIEKIGIVLPQLNEQKKIVEILTCIDSVIEYTDQIVAKLERLKRGLMQQLLTHGIGHTETKQTPIGKLPKEWEPISLSKVFKLSSGKPRPANISEEASPEVPFPIYGGNGVLGYSSMFLLDHQTIVIGRVGEYCGAVYKTKERSWITDNALYATELSKDFDITFLKYLLSFINLNKYQKKMGQPLITQTILYGIDVPLPPLPEQHKIVDILSTAEGKLELENKERLRLETIKRGLMDLLLTGKVRIKGVY